MWKRWLATAALAAFATGGTFSAQMPDKVDFARDVQPIFRQNCYGCHGPRQQNNNFRLDRRRDAMRGGTIPVIGPGNSEASHLYLRLVGRDTLPGQTMPPTGSLTPQQLATIKTWIDQGAEWPDAASGDAPSTPPDPKATRLMNALRTNDVQTFRSMAAESNIGSLKGPGGSTPLMFAVLYGDSAAVKRLLEGGADPNVKNEAGATALMWAVNDLGKTRLLVDKGADVNAHSEDHRTPLLIASGLPGAAPVVKLLLEHGADVNAKAPSLGGDTTPLVQAAAIGDEAQFRLLIEHGADVNAAGPPALGLAMRAQCMACVELLLKTMNPALLTPTMVMGGPPLGPALATPFLLERGADINARDPLGRTLLMMAAASDAMPVDVVKLLLAKGVDVNATCPTGETALSLAKLRGNTPIVDLLLKAGAKDMAAAPTPMAKPAPAPSIRAALERTLPLLQRNDETFLKKAGCVSCHNNTLTAVTVAEARKKGLPVDARIAQHQLTTIGNYIDAWRERALQGNGIPGDSDTVSYILLGLAAENFPADPATDAMATFLLQKQFADGGWRIFAHRPPIESSDIEVTALSMRAIQLYAPKAGRAAYDRSVERAVAWLVKAAPMSTEDHALRLLGLSWAGADKDLVRKSATALAAAQRPDGGWSQLPSLTSDAYATGEALVALAESGAMATSDAAYKRGVQFLLGTQFADGSWFVKSRAIPLQPHFESGFPFGRDQFISAAGTNWAARALALAYSKPS
jgi:ankyrin repeat protein